MRRGPKILLIVIGSLLALILIGPLLVPVVPAPGTRPAQELADPDSQFIEINGLQVHYKTAGQGERTFILLHGFGASVFSWHSVMEPLGAYGRVIAYDRPAFGLTERPTEWQGQSPYSPQANLELLAGLLDELDAGPVILVGNSAGGTLAMQFTLEHPERVQALILVDPAVYNGGGPAWMRWFGKTPQMQRLGPYLVRSIQSRGLGILEQAWYDPARITPETWEAYQRPLQAENWDEALWELTIASQESNLPERLMEFFLPTLVISGDSDTIVPTKNSIQLAQDLPNAALVIIPQAGHVPHEEQPDLFMQAVDEFLKTIPAGQ